MELSFIDSHIQILSEKKTILLSKEGTKIWDLLIDFPGEYEKSGILVHVTDVWGILVYELRIEGRMIAFLPEWITESSESLGNALENIDILLISGSKETTKLSEFLDARVVVPYGEWRDQFLASFWQDLESVALYKTKEADFDGENTLFIRLS